MKILYITLENLSLQKGSVVHIKEVVNGFRKLGHRVGLIARSENRFEMADHFYNLHRGLFFLLRFMGMKRQPYFVSSLMLFIYLFKTLSQYDLIYARDYHTVIIASLPRLLFKKRLVFEVNGLANEELKLKRDFFSNRILAFFTQKAEKMATRYSDRIISVTPQIASYLIQYYHCAPVKVRVVSNGVNNEEFRPIFNGDLLSDLRKNLGIAPDEMVIAFVGNLAPWQGVEYLIQAAPMLLKSIKGVKFLIIGEGRLKEKFKGEVKHLGISNYFIFTGMVDYKKIPLYINIADICVLPKRRLKSGYSPIKLYEYMACGKPVIASRVEGLEFIEREGVGRLTEPEDVKSLGEAMGDLLRDVNKRVSMGSIGFQIARERYSWGSKVAEIEKVLEELV